MCVSVRKHHSEKVSCSALETAQLKISGGPSCLIYYADLTLQFQTNFPILLRNF